MTYLNFELGDIVVLPLPFSDLTNKKLRPGLVISNNNYNKFNPDLIISKITSIGHSLPYDVIFNNSDLDQGELNKKSTINCGAIYTVNKKLIAKKIAKLNNKKVKEVKEKIKGLFEL